MPWTSKPDVDRWFTYQSPSVDGISRIRRVREKARELAHLILEVTPPSADQSAAVRKLREVVMVASAAIALERPIPQRPADDVSHG